MEKRSPFVTLYSVKAIPIAYTEYVLSVVVLVFLYPLCLTCLSARTYISQGNVMACGTKENLYLFFVNKGAQFKWRGKGMSLISKNAFSWKSNLPSLMNRLHAINLNKWRCMWKGFTLYTIKQRQSFKKILFSFYNVKHANGNYICCT